MALCLILERVPGRLKVGGFRGLRYPSMYVLDTLTVYNSSHAPVSIPFPFPFPFPFLAIILHPFIYPFTQEA